jgi:hypothetical protein
VPSTETATNIRETRRFVFRRPCEASFGDVPIRLIDLSRSGAQAMHAARIAPGTESRIELTVPGASRRLSLRARVVWSRRAESSGNQKIGLAITDERFDLAADLIDHMVRMRWVEVDKQSTKPGFSAKTPFAPAHSLEQARRALAFVSNDSPAANRWRDRVRASAPPTNRRPIEVLAAWELLARSVDVELIDFAHRERESFVLSASELLDDEGPGLAIAEARRALDFLARHRTTAARWFSLVHDAMPDASHPIEVLAAWELLGRSIDVEVVAIAHRERAGDCASA